MGIFDVDGKFYRFLSRFVDMLKLNFLWLLCSVPIVTIGPSTIAAYSVTMDMIDETEGYIARKFFKTFKSNLKNGIPLGIIFIIAMWALWLDFQLATSGENTFVFMTIFLVAVFVCLTGFMFAFPLEVRYENTLVRTLKNSYDISVRYFARFLLLVVVLAIEVATFMFTTTTMFIGILIGPACAMLTVSGFAVPFFREIEKEDGAVIRPESSDNENASERKAVFNDHPDVDKGIASRAHMNTRNK